MKLNPFLGLFYGYSFGKITGVTQAKTGECRFGFDWTFFSQGRITLWHEQTVRYTSELRELKQQIRSQLENLDKEKEVLRTNLDSVGSRVDRVERELDYLETQNGAQPCVDVDDKLIEQQVILVQEKQKAKFLRLSGETLACLKGFALKQVRIRVIPDFFSGLQTAAT